MEGEELSIFQFLASDKVLDEVENHYLKFMSINEAIKQNIKISNFILNDTKINRDKKILMVCDSEDHLDDLEIKNDMYYSSEYAKEYSDKKYFSELQWVYSKARSKELIKYLEKELKNLDEIEIWNIWLDDNESASIKSVNITELSIQDLEFLKGSDKPASLIINKKLGNTYD